MRLLHTSDWHLGNALMDHSRTAEFSAFLEWLLRQLREQQVDVLLVSGDVFDSTAPSAEARRLYCDFLSRADETGCSRVILTAGNHDSMAQLQADEPFLERHHAALVSHLTAESAASCLVPVSLNSTGETVLFCAVPFLRQDVSRAVPADDAAARATAYVDGVADVLAAVAREAEAWKSKHGGRVVCMAHQSVQGVMPTTGTRSEWGKVEAIRPDAFAPVFDYVALGHIHRCYPVQEKRMYYCGSPLPMGMDEAEQPASVLLVDTDGMRVTPLRVPRFTCFERRTCNTPDELEQLPQQLAALSTENGGAPVWLELHYTGNDRSQRALLERMSELFDGTAVAVHRGRVEHAESRRSVMEAAEQPETLSDYGPERIFAMRMNDYDAANTPLTQEERAMLVSLFRQVTNELQSPTESL